LIFSGAEVISETVSDIESFIFPTYFVIFFPQEKVLAKQSLDLDPDIRTILFGTHISTEKRKGFFKLVDPIVSRAAKKQIKENLAKLKEILESMELNRKR